MKKRIAGEVSGEALIAPVADASEDTTHWIQMVRKLVVIFGVMNMIVLGSVIAAALSGRDVNTFMWVRAGILLVATPLLYRWATNMEDGWVPAYQRLKRVSIVVPIALVVIDFIPGTCPSWYAWLQVCVAIALLSMAGVLHRRSVKALFTGGV